MTSSFATAVLSSPRQEYGEAKGTFTSGDVENKTHGEEKAKPSRRLKFAIDFAYTLNHSVICTLTDPITDIPIGVFTPKAINWVKSKMGRKIVNYEETSRFSPAVSWLVGEVTGDFGAVPVVVGLQHFAPGLMNGIGKLASPIAKPIFQRSAVRSARAEFKLAGMDTDSPEFDARVKELYDREMGDLPKAIMWTIASPAINLTMQKLVMGNQVPVSYLLLGKALGSITTSSLTVGLRAASPRHAQKWDDLVTEKLGKPATSAVAKLLGLDAEKVQAGVKEKANQHKKGPSWSERHASQPSADIQR